MKKLSIFLLIFSMILSSVTPAYSRPRKARTATIQGRVTNSLTNQAISKALVRAGRYRVSTNASGKHVIKNVRVWFWGRIFRVRASAKGYYSRSRWIYVRRGRTRTLNFKLKPRITTATIKGRVIDKDTRKGIAGAKVEAMCWWRRYRNKWRYTVYTDANGYYEIKNAQTLRWRSLYRISVSKKGHRSSSRYLYVRPGRTYRINFALLALRPPVVLKIISPKDGAETKEAKLKVKVSYRIHNWWRYRFFDGWRRARRGKVRFWWFRRTIDLQLDNKVIGKATLPWWKRAGTRTFTISNYSSGEHGLQAFAYLDRWKRILLAKSNIVRFAYIYDTIPPVISDISPTNNALINNNLPEISAILSDVTSGIDKDTIILKLDDVEVTAIYDEATGKLSYTPITVLEDGTHTVSIEVKDKAGNKASIEVSFTIDTTAPELEITSHKDRDVVIGNE